MATIVFKKSISKQIIFEIFMKNFSLHKQYFSGKYF